MYIADTMAYFNKYYKLPIKKLNTCEYCFLWSKLGVLCSGICLFQNHWLEGELDLLMYNFILAISIKIIPIPINIRNEKIADKLIFNLIRIFIL